MSTIETNPAKIMSQISSAMNSVAPAASIVGAEQSVEANASLQGVIEEQKRQGQMLTQQGELLKQILEGQKAAQQPPVLATPSLQEVSAHHVHHNARGHHHTVA